MWFWTCGFTHWIHVWFTLLVWGQAVPWLYKKKKQNRCPKKRAPKSRWEPFPGLVGGRLSCPFQRNQHHVFHQDNVLLIQQGVWASTQCSVCVFLFIINDERRGLVEVSFFCSKYVLIRSKFYLFFPTLYVKIYSSNLKELLSSNTLMKFCQSTVVKWILKPLRFNIPTWYIDFCCAAGIFCVRKLLPSTAPTPGSVKSHCVFLRKVKTERRFSFHSDLVSFPGPGRSPKSHSTALW